MSVLNGSRRSGTRFPHAASFLCILLAAVLCRHGSARLAMGGLTRGTPAPQSRNRSLPPTASPRRVLGMASLPFTLPGVNETKLAIAGAMAGGFTNLLLHPIDTAKTLRQSNPAQYPASLIAVLLQHGRKYGVLSLWSGLAPAVIGSMPSSSLYFGVYEYMKRRLAPLLLPPQTPQGTTDKTAPQQSPGSVGGQAWRRFAVHMVSAASGNTASSLVFVPKEVIKQQLQTIRTHGAPGATASVRGVVSAILQQEGLRGLYRGYRATLLRNIPSAVLRFALYEELKIAIQEHETLGKWLKGHSSHLVAGAIAGAVSSAATTPFDVVKTRMAINLCPPGDVMECLVSVAKHEGMGGLYAGLAFRMLYSALFTAVGFSAFESSKRLLGVADYQHNAPTQPAPQAVRGSKPGAFTSPLGLTPHSKGPA